MITRISEVGVLRSLCRDSFYDFVREFWGQIVQTPLLDNWHVGYLCNELQIVAERVFESKEKLYDLVINVPPGSTKSTICSQMFPAWVWTRMPHAQFICASYSHPLALKDSLRARDIVESDLYRLCFPGLDLREDQNTKGLFANTKGGFRFAIGVEGGVTGQHGHFLVVDDPLDPEQALSEAELRTTNRWMEQTLPTRKIRLAENVVPTILIMQRLHQDDPAGRMIAGPNVKHICLPGEIRSHDKIVVSPPELRERYVDGLLDPQRLNAAVLKELRQKLGEYGYAAQVLQSPVPLGGGLFHVDKFVLAEVAPKRLGRPCRSWDKAGTEGGGKYTAGVKMAKDEKGFYWVLDVIREQMGATRREATIKQTAELDSKEVEIIVEAEGGSGGKESAENTVRNLAGYVVHAYHPTGDKAARAYAYASQVGAGNVFLLNRPWTQAYIEEHRFFPMGTYSDQVDASSGAFNWIAKGKVRVGGW